MIHNAYFISIIVPFVTVRYILQNVTLGESVTWQHSLVSLQHGGWGLRAALWCCWGAPVMAALASQLLLCLNSRHPATNITASSKTTANTFYAGQPTCAAVCNVAIALANLVSLILS